MWGGAGWALKAHPAPICATDHLLNEPENPHHRNHAQSLGNIVLVAPEISHLSLHGPRTNYHKNDLLIEK